MDTFTRIHNSFNTPCINSVRLHKPPMLTAFVVFIFLMYRYCNMFQILWLVLRIATLVFCLADFVKCLFWFGDCTLQFFHDIWEKLSKFICNAIVVVIYCVIVYYEFSCYLFTELFTTSIYLGVCLCICRPLLMWNRDRSTRWQWVLLIPCR